MFGLTQHVCSNKCRLRTTIGNNHDFARPGQHIDVTVSINGFFRQRNKQIARPHDLVDTGNRFRAECQRSNRLRPADPEDAVHPGQGCGSQHQRIDRTIFRRRDHHDDLPDSGNYCRDSGHQH